MNSNAPRETVRKGHVKSYTCGDLSYPSKKLRSTDNQANLPELNSLMYKHLSSTPTKALLLQNLTRVSDRSIPIIHI